MQMKYKYIHIKPKDQQSVDWILKKFSVYIVYEAFKLPPPPHKENSAFFIKIDKTLSQAKIMQYDKKKSTKNGWNVLFKTFA